MTIREEQRRRVGERLAGHLLAMGLSRTSVRQLAAGAEVRPCMTLCMEVTSGFLGWLETQVDIEDPERRVILAAAERARDVRFTP